GVLLVVPGESPGRNGEVSFDGVWRTSVGTVTLKQSGDAVTGTYGDAGQFTLKGTIKGKKLTFEYEQGKTKGDGHWRFADSGHPSSPAMRSSCPARSLTAPPPGYSRTPSAPRRATRRATARSGPPSSSCTART